MSTAVAASQPGDTPRTPAPTAPPVVAPLEGSARVLGTVALAMATFMNVLDLSIANVSIPAIAGELGVSPNQATWVITSFGVANAISVPLTGWLTKRFGQVRLFVASMLLFVLASLLCGLAPSIEMLIAARVLQGLVAGPMVPLSQTLLMASYPPAKVGMALAFWGMTTLVAPVVGPLLGGAITDNISWPWIFYINVPVGVLAASITWSIYRHRDSGRMHAPLDRWGLALLVLWVGALQIMVDKGKELDWFGSNQIVMLAIVAGVGFCFFLAWELTERQPIVNLHLFRNRNFVTATIAFSLAYGMFMGNVVLLPLWLQQWMGYTATWAGMSMAPVGVLAFVLSPWVGKNVSRFDPRMLATVSFVGYALVMLMRSHFTAQVTYFDVFIPTALQGVAVAFFFIPLQAIIFSGVPPELLPAAAGVSNFMRIMSGAVFTSLFTTLWDDRAVMHHVHLVEAASRANGPLAGAIAQMQAAGMSAEQSAAVVMRTLDQQAYTMAATDLFRVSAGIYILLLALVWLSRPKRAGAPIDTGAH